MEQDEDSGAWFFCQCFCTGFSSQGNRVDSSPRLGSSRLEAAVGLPCAACSGLPLHVHWKTLRKILAKHRDQGFRLYLHPCFKYTNCICRRCFHLSLWASANLQGLTLRMGLCSFQPSVDKEFQAIAPFSSHVTRCGHTKHQAVRLCMEGWLRHSNGTMQRGQGAEIGVESVSRVEEQCLPTY